MCMQNTSQTRALTERITHQLSCMIDHLQEQRALRGLAKNGIPSACPFSICVQLACMPKKEHSMQVASCFVGCAVVGAICSQGCAQYTVE